MRQKYNEDVLNKLSEASALIKNYTDFGVKAWIRRLEHYDNDTKDLPANLLFRQVLEASDGASELIKAGCINICKPLLRVALDCYFQFAFLIEDEESRSKHFLYHYNMAKFVEMERLLFPESKNSFNSKISNDRVFNKVQLTEEEEKLAWVDYNTLKEVLESEENMQIAQEYGKKKMKNWYYYFIKSQKIEDLASRLKQDALYEILFKSLSSFIHGEDIVHSNIVFFPNERVGLKHLRDAEKLNYLTNSMVILIERAILLFIQKKMNSDTGFLLELKTLMERGAEFRSKNRSQ